MWLFRFSHLHWFSDARSCHLTSVFTRFELVSAFTAVKLGILFQPTHCNQSGPSVMVGVLMGQGPLGPHLQIRPIYQLHYVLRLWFFLSELWWTPEARTFWWMRETTDIFLLSSNHEILSYHLDGFGFCHWVFCHVSLLLLVTPFWPVALCSSPDCFNCCHLCLLLIPTHILTALLFYSVRLSDVLHSWPGVICLFLHFPRAALFIQVCQISFHLWVLLLCYSQWFLLYQSFMCPVSLVCIGDQICFPCVESDLYI